MSDSIPDTLQYTKDHEWAKVEGNRVTVGITAFAVEQLGDITLVNLDAKVGDSLTSGKGFGTIESVKTLSDLFAPVAGKLVAINTDLDSKPELVNEDCYGKGWMVVLETTADLSDLMSAQAYADHVKASGG